MIDLAVVGEHEEDVDRIIAIIGTGFRIGLRSEQIGIRIGYRQFTET